MALTLVKKLFNREKTLSLRALTLFSLQMSVMLNAGVPYLTALKSLTETSDSHLNQASRKVLKSIEGGSSLSGALSLLPESFNPFFVNMVRINENTGRLGSALAELSGYLSREERQRMHVTQALIYPAFILLTSAAMVAFLVFYMLPQFMPVIAECGSEVPPLTAFLLFFTGNPRVMVNALIILVIAAIVCLPSYRTPMGIMSIQRAIYETPVLKTMFLSSLLARFSRTLAMQIKSGNNIVSSLLIISKETTGYYRLDDSVLEAIRMLRHEGSSLTEAMKSAGHFPSLMVSMVAAGEESGDLATILEKYAALQDMNSELAIGDMLKVLEPVMLLFMGVVVGFIVLSAFLPIFQLLKNL
jgi:type IV pilus assembly protein PilC